MWRLSTSNFIKCWGSFLQKYCCEKWLWLFWSFSSSNFSLYQATKIYTMAVAEALDGATCSTITLSRSQQDWTWYSNQKYQEVALFHGVILSCKISGNSIMIPKVLYPRNFNCFMICFGDGRIFNSRINICSTPGLMCMYLQYVRPCVDFNQGPSHLALRAGHVPSHVGSPIHRSRLRIWNPGFIHPGFTFPMKTALENHPTFRKWIVILVDVSSLCLRPSWHWVPLGPVA